MAVENNGPEGAFQGPGHKVDTGEGHSSGLEKAESEPKQGTDEDDAKKNRVDWNPPPGNPGSDQDAQVKRDQGTARTE